MGKNKQGRNRKERRRAGRQERMKDEKILREVHPEKNTFEPINITPRTEAQQKYWDCIDHDTCVIGIGVPGSGKTFLAAYKAGLAYARGEIDKIIVTRPNVSLGPTLGLLPGTMEEKFMPWMTPYIDGLEAALGPNRVKAELFKSIIAVPVEFMRGRSFKNCWVLCDEAQNLGISSMQCLVTRMGEDSKLIISGDEAQCDLHRSESSGLTWLLDKIDQYTLPIEVTEFGWVDCQRSEFTKMMIDIIRKPE